MINKIGYFAFCIGIACLSSCYSFKGISIPATVSTFYVDDFKLKVGNAPGDIDQRFSEALREKIRNESSLNYTEQDPDIEFSGAVITFRTTSEAPTAESLAALNRLEISVKVKYVNNRDEEDTWNNSFSFFENYDGNTDLGSVQDGLIESIFEQLTEDVFNKAFTNW